MHHTMHSLQSLPVELIANIAREILSGSRIYSNAELRDEAEDNDYKSLASFAQTCKIYYEHATPVLYAMPYVSKYAAPLVRTLVERPELARLVKVWVMDESDVYWNVVDPSDNENGPEDAESGDWAISLDEAALFNGVCQEHEIIIARDDGPGPGMGEAQGNDAKVPIVVIPSYRRNKMQDWEVQKVACALRVISILQCRNVRQIQCPGHHGYAALPQNVAFCFPCLQKLSIHDGAVPYSTIVSGKMNWLLAAGSPSLTTLAGYRIRRLDAELCAPNLTALELTESHLMEECMSSLYVSFPNLQRFTFEAGGTRVSDETILSPAQLIAGLLQWRGTLEYIHVDFYNACDLARDDWEDQDFATTLRPFDKLEEVYAPLELFNATRDDLTPSFFRSLFPPSLVKLNCAQIDGEWTVEDLTHLIGQEFPNLKEICLVGGKGTIDASVIEQFSKGGIILTNA